jgi:hypothetical protein
MPDQRSDVCAPPYSTDVPGMTRDELHFRRVDMRGYRRSDGLFEIEGRVLDRKPFDFAPPTRGRMVPANEPVHDLGVRMVFDGDLVVRSIETFSDAFPFSECPGGGRALQSMVGLSMTRGWGKAVRERLGGGRSCTHLMELLMPLATTAFQALSALRMNRPEELDASGRPLRIDSCHAYRQDGEEVLKRWPEFHRPAAGPR